jgi:glycerol kinase
LGRYILAVDQGTTGTRAIVFDENGTPVPRGWAYRRHRQIYPKPGWVEHDPEEIWSNTLTVIKEAVERSGISPGEIEAIGVTNQRETVVVWDRRSGRPFYNAIVWQDRRTAELCEKVEREYGGLVREKTGLIVDPYFSATKIWWLLENVEGLRGRAAKGEAVLGTIDSWLIWNLTGGPAGGVHVTDYSNASRTMLFNIHRLDWDDELLEVFGRIPRESLPEPRPSSDPNCYGYTRGKAAEALGGRSIPVCAAVGDQQAALFGQAGFNPGEAKVTHGTGSFLLMNIGSKPLLPKSKLLLTVYYSTRRGSALYALEGSIFASGAVINWLRDGLKIIEVPEEVDPLAEAAEGNLGVYFVPAFAGLGAPYWDPYARAVIVGITAAVERRHIVRAALESIAYMTRDVLEAMAGEVGARPSELKSDGGVSKSNFLMQFQADITGIRVVRPKVYETTSLGAAFLAGLAVGVWGSLEELRRLWKPERVFEPKLSPEEREKLYRGWKAAVRRALGWAREVPWAYT